VWAQRIRYIILDEVHCISSSDGGKLWEHILLLSNAPFLALSATVGEPEAFVAWLQRLKNFQGSDSGGRDESYTVRLVQHSERWVDLRRHVYLGKTGRGSEDASALVKAGRLHVRAKVDHTSAEIDMAEVLETLHPLASFTSTQLEMGSAAVNVRFEPRDSLALFNALWSVCRQAKESSPVKQRSDALIALDPVKYFSGEIIFISKPQSVQYETAIKNEFENWIASGWRKECVQVLRLLGNDLVEDDVAGKCGKLDGEYETQKEEMVNRLFHLMCALHRQDRLPAVVFNFDRTLCESIAYGFNAILGRAEDAARAEHSKTLAKSAKVESQKDKVQKRIRDKVLSEKKEEAMLQEMAEMAESSSVESAGIDEVSFKAQFTFVQEGRSSKQDFERITESARKIMGEGHPLIQILRRGIGVHHSGLQNKYRMAGAYQVLSIAQEVFEI
jgi:ATP-dependent RNA helicase DDX60